MARLGLIADIHGNLPALRAVIEAAGPVDRWLCAGDIAGHLPMLDEVVTVLRDIGADCVLGNHDRALLDGTALGNSSAGTRALQLQRHAIGPEAWAWLASLPETLTTEVGGLPVTMMHGGPADTLTERMRAVTPEARTLATGGLLVLGHTHAPLDEIAKSHAIVNPGAVGLPSMGDTRAQAAVFDTDSRTLTPVRVSYDTAELFARMRALDYDERYFNCLEAGRWVGFRGTPPPVRVIVLGASVYGEIAAGIVGARPDMELAGFVDDRAGIAPDGSAVLGRVADLADIAREAGVTDVAVAIGTDDTRRRLSETVRRAGVRPARLIHPTAVVDRTARLGAGCIVDALAYVGPHCTLGAGVSVWPGAVLAHHVTVGDFASVKHRAAIGGNSTVAEGVKVAFGSVWPSGSRIGPES